MSETEQGATATAQGEQDQLDDQVEELADLDDLDVDFDLDEVESRIAPLALALVA
jgi:hypothetical protein